MSDSISPSTKLPAWLADGDALFGIGLGEEVTSKTMAPQVKIGPYRLIEKLGEGGLGVVWRAVQSEPIHREVAIKLTKSRMHYRPDVLARFEVERQVLARMQHPNIAAILDAGSLPDERPYFVMELVNGVPLTDYCVKRGLGVRGRLGLFITICHAVHHAHQKGILHRDLKPSNILVADQDGQPVPKVIDFGIAKAMDETDASLNDPFFKTQLGALPCATYQYMSPEQASRGQTDVDTRSDIYTLGVILYELLTGKLPLPDELARSNSFDAIAAHLRDREPTRPSERVTVAGTKTSDLRGDLDWIVLRALEKDRERRYESAAALAEDLQRHLAHEPVNAGPPGALYRCGKWVRRHRVAFVSITAVALSLCIGLVTTLMALKREAEQRERADANRALATKREREATAEKVKAESARQTANIARARAEKLIDDMLYDLRDKLESVGRLPLLETVAKSAQEYFDSVPITEDDDSQQRHRAAMLQNRGRILMAKGQLRAAKDLFKQSLDVMQFRAEAQPHNVQRLHDLALAHERVGTAQEALRDNLGAANSYEEMSRVFQHLAETAPADAGSWREDRSVAYERLGDFARKQRNDAEALTQYRAGVEWLRLLPGSDVVRKRLAVMESKLGILDRAESMQHFERSLQLWLALRIAHPDDSSLMEGCATVHGKLAAASSGAVALDHAVQQNTMWAELAARDPLRVEWQRNEAVSLLQLGILLESEKRWEKAAEMYLDALQRFKVMHDAERDLGAVAVRLAGLYFKRNEPATARRYAQQALEWLNTCQSRGDYEPDINSWIKTAQELSR